MSSTTASTDLFDEVAKLLARIKVAERKDRWITGSQLVRCFVSFPTYSGGCFIEVKLETEQPSQRDILQALAENTRVAILGKSGAKRGEMRLSPGGIVSFNLGNYPGATGLQLIRS